MSISFGSKRFLVIAAVLAAAVGFLLVVAFMRGAGGGGTTGEVGGANANSNARQQQDAQAAAAPTQADSRAQTTAAQQDRGTAASGDSSSTMAHIFGIDQTPAQESGPRDWLDTLAAVTIRLTLAALLAAMLAYRPRRFSLHFKRNPFVAQTQILMAVVASALMMVVGDSAARAFGIFAAASLVRFRTNIKDPKEITVLLVSLAIGLATGVGRLELGLILSFFVLLLLWGLEYRETEQVTRAMELTVKTRSIGTTQDALLGLFRKYDFDAEMRTIDRPDEKDSIGEIVYYVSVTPSASIDRLSQEILAADPKNIDGVAWDQQKNTSYFYQ